MTPLARAAPGARPQGGFAVIAVLIVVSLMLSLGLTYMQRTALATESSPAGRDMVQANEDVDSALAFARAARDAGRATGSQSVSAGGGQVAVTTSTLTSDGHTRWDLVRVDGNDLGSSLVAESERVAAPGEAAVSHPDLLPSIEDDIVADLLADAGLSITAYSGNVTLEDVEIDGLLVLETGATVTVRNVIVNGAVLSRQALETDAVGDFDDSTAPELLIDGSFLVRPGDDVPGVAVLMPDGVVNTSAGLSESFQLLGAVVAHTVELTTLGTVDGAIAFSSLTLSDDVERPGYGREPLTLPDVLDPGSTWADSFFAIVPLNQTADELTGASAFWNTYDLADDQAVEK